MKKRSSSKIGIVLLLIALGFNQLGIGITYAINEVQGHNIHDSRAKATQEMFFYRIGGIDELGVETVTISGYIPAHNPNHPNLTIPEMNAKGQKIVGIDAESFEATGLTSVEMEDSIQMIGRQAFADNTLTKVRLSSNLTVISESAFLGNKQLKSIEMPSSLRTIGALAFSDCGFTSIYIPDHVSELGIGAFRRNDLTMIHLPANLKRIQSSVFWANENLKYVEIPVSVTRIENDAFRDCGLESLILPENLTWLGTCAFMNNRIKMVTIPGTVSDWGQFAFANNAIETVVVEEGVQIVGSDFINSLDFGANIGNHVSSLTLPSSLIRIEYYTFAESGLLYFDLPASLKYLEDDCFEGQSVTMDYLIGEDHSIVRLPKEMTISKFGVTSAGVMIDANCHELKIPKQFDKIEYYYKLGVFHGVERNLTGTLTLGKGKVIVRLLDYHDVVLEEVEVFYNETLVPSRIPTRAGYTFIGWDKGLENIVASQDMKAQYKRFPEIIAPDQRLKVGQAFYPLTDVNALDADGNSIKDIKVIANHVDTSIKGTYVVMLEVIDQWGGKAATQYQVIVEDGYADRILKDQAMGITVRGTLTNDKNQTGDQTNQIVPFILLIASGIVCVMLIRKGNIT